MVYINKQLSGTDKKEFRLDEKTFPALFVNGERTRDIAIRQEGDDIIVQTILGDANRIQEAVEQFINERMEQLQDAIAMGYKAQAQLSALQSMRK